MISSPWRHSKTGQVPLEYILSLTRTLSYKERQGENAAECDLKLRILSDTQYESLLARANITKRRIRFTEWVLQAIAPLSYRLLYCSISTQNWTLTVQRNINIVTTSSNIVTTSSNKVFISIKRTEERYCKDFRIIKCSNTTCERKTKSNNTHLRLK